MPRIARDLLHQRWVHSHEEDTPTEMVFRPSTYAFPPSRGRTAFELRPDGTFIDVGIAPTDAPQESAGVWELVNDDTLQLRPMSAAPPRRSLKIVSADPDRLRIRKTTS